MSSRPKVLHLISSTQRRGAELFAIRLAERLQADGFENVMCAGQITGLDGAEVPPGIQVLDLNGGKRSLLPKDLSAALKVRRLVREVAPDILVGHGASTLKYAVAAKSAARKTPAVYINIGVASHWASSGVKKHFNRALLRRIDTVVSVSQATRADFQAHYSFPEERTVYIANGVDSRRFSRPLGSSERAQVRAELNLSLDSPVILTVGSLTPEKNQEALIPVLADIKSQGIAGNLVIAGSGPLAELLRQRADAAGAGALLRLAGSVADVPRLMSAADVFVLPSKTEGMPGVLIEAGMAGLPSVAFNVGGIGEVIEDRITGFLVPPYDTKMFAHRLAELLTSREKRTAMGKAAKTRCVGLFDMDKITKEYERLLLDLIGNTRRFSPRTHAEDARPVSSGR